MKKMKFLISDYDIFNENKISIEICPYCESPNLRILSNDRLFRCEDCLKIFSKNKIIIKIFNEDEIFTILDKKSSDEDRKLIFNFLKDNIRKFMNGKNITNNIKKFLKIYHIKIDIDEELTYKNIFDYFNNTTYEDCHCKNINCDKDTKFVGFRDLKQFPSGYRQFCSERCFHEWFSEKQKGINNTIHRMDPNKMPEYRKKMSDIMTDMIEKGKFTPNLLNSWHNTKFKTIINNDIIYFRSCWEAFFNIVNPTLNYEKRRIPYFMNGIKHSYIVDFDDIVNKILYEIKPISMEEIEKNIIKRNAVIDWCTNNEYKFVVINDDWFRSNYSKYKFLLEDQPDKERIMKNLKRYENKKDK